ncbi:hypothetical protein SAMN04488564_110345 [Lentzea waywayandensis]|uniref:Uncharacterized protein n=1 Tax=Lentzea waywayandensis TaxID=84724 RepID=A0A1I6FBF4_9PSEU|nr:hypothetical protein [Lentzea waywayandensis]SFR27143.1 hypothetical protein SAMN04488564_110345 [Lentzea waywayandensis]
MNTSEWSAGENSPLLLMRFEPQVLTEEFGIVFTEDVDELGPLKLAVLERSFGTMGLVRYVDSSMRGTAVYVDEAADLELAHRAVVSEFGLTGQDISWAARTAGLLNAVRDNARLREVLASFGFDVSRAGVRGTASIESGLPLEPLAGDFAGGRFYLCGDAEWERQVLYASAEGQAGLIASSLREALQLVIGLPSWQDCLTCAGGVRIDLTADAAEASELLSLDLPPQDVLLNRLHAAVARSAPEFVFRDETGEYEGLDGSSLPETSPKTGGHVGYGRREASGTIQ